MLSRAEGKADLLAAVTPILDHLSQSGLPGSADELAERFPLNSALLATIREKVLAGLEAGWLTPKEAGGVKFGRVASAGEDSRGYTIDAVDMNGPGPGHTHPQGEVDLCFALEEGSLFDGNPEGWVVYGPGSWHVPTVSNGRMAILYFLPGGAIRFEARPT